MLLRFYFLKKSLNMSSLIANQVKTNMRLISLNKLYIILTTFVPLFTQYNNNYNNNFLYDTSICYSTYNRNCFVRTPHATWHKTA